jgi:hypothetical protein
MICHKLEYSKDSEQHNVKSKTDLYYLSFSHHYVIKLPQMIKSLKQTVRVSDIYKLVF